MSNQYTIIDVLRMYKSTETASLMLIDDGVLSVNIPDEVVQALARKMEDTIKRVNNLKIKRKSKEVVRTNIKRGTAHMGIFREIRDSSNTLSTQVNVLKHAMVGLSEDQIAELMADHNKEKETDAWLNTVTSVISQD